MADSRPGPIRAPDSIYTATLLGGPDTSGDDLATAGGILSIFGALNGAIGSFYAARSQQSQLRSQALSFEHEQFMANLNARNAETEAQEILRAGEQQIGIASLQAAQAKGSFAADVGARGVRAGDGSAAEIAASMELAKRLDAAALNTSAIRAAGAARMGGVNARNRGLLAGVSAQNARASARSIQPGVAASTSLLGGAGQVANYWAYNKRRQG